MAEGKAGTKNRFMQAALPRFSGPLAVLLAFLLSAHLLPVEAFVVRSSPGEEPSPAVQAFYLPKKVDHKLSRMLDDRSRPVRIDSCELLSIKAGEDRAGLRSSHSGLAETCSLLSDIFKPVRFIKREDDKLLIEGLDNKTVVSFIFRQNPWGHEIIRGIMENKPWWRLKGLSDLSFFRLDNGLSGYVVYGGSSIFVSASPSLMNEQADKVSLGKIKVYHFIMKKDMPGGDHLLFHVVCRAVARLNSPTSRVLTPFS